MSGDSDADLVGDFYAALSLETDFSEEKFDVGFEPFAESCRQFGYEGNISQDYVVPGLGEVGGDDFLLLSLQASREEVLPAE